MTEKHSIKSSLAGVGASGISLLGIGGGSACAAACGPVCAVPVASLFGASTAGMSTWITQLLPLFTAMSAVAFTVAFYSIYRKKADPCCGDTVITPAHKVRSRRAKSLFWVGLLLSFGFYANAMISSGNSSEQELIAAPTASSCQTDTTTCQPTSCNSKTSCTHEE